MRHVLTKITNTFVYIIICLIALIYHYVYKTITAPCKKKKIVHQHEKDIVIVITGCDTGFGNLLSKNMVKQPKTFVVSLCLTATAAEDLKELGIHGIQCDVTCDKDVERAASYIGNILQEKKAVLHTLVNNAGVASPGDFAFFEDMKVFQKVMDVNFYGQVRVTQALLPLFLRYSPLYGGRILNLSSVCGTTATPGNSSYNCSKFAVEAWSDCLRLELAPFNMKVAKIRPGQFNTSIQSDYAKRFLQNFQKAPKYVQDLYGGMSYHKKARELYESIGMMRPELDHTGISEKTESKSTSDPMKVVDALMEIIGGNLDKIEPYYWLGNDSQTLFKALLDLPTSVTDSIKHDFIQIRPVQ